MPDVSMGVSRYKVAGYAEVAKAIKAIAEGESTTLHAPNGGAIVVNTPEARLSVIAGALTALLNDMDSEAPDA